MTSPDPDRIDDDPPVDRPIPQKEEAQQFAVAAAKLLSDYDCADIRVLDVRGVSPLTYYLVIASGTSDRQLRSLLKQVAGLGEQQGFERFGDDKDEAATWMVADFVEVMVHLFEPNTREHYDLEMLWGDAPAVDWQRKA